MIISAVATAHHGGAAYDGSETVEVIGKVTRFEFVNPHVLIYADVSDEDGNTVEWSGELTSPNRLARSERSAVRWHKDIFQPGDDITLIGNPARSGAPSLRLQEVLNADGTKMIGGG
ncbi:MAG: hypothetical protein F4053_11380 [Proteobacteria bacterium]|nr:hypothetical protein [Pseudomonadota bacterium]MYJ96152.1 hypothetical protein [Pseudomonadota bacterium]